MTLGFLQRIQDILRERSGNDKMVLSDYFDFIGGTSTGSIISGALSLGKPVEEISDLYHRLGAEIFKPRLWINKYLGPLSGLFGAQYSIEALNKHLHNVFGDMTIGDKKLKTGICKIGSVKSCDSIILSCFSAKKPCCGEYRAFSCPGK